MNDIISLIILLSNETKLDQVIANILSQSYSEWELIIVTNLTDSINISIYNDIRIKLFFFDSEPITPFTLFNILPNLNGDLICILNPNDISECIRLTKQSLFIKENNIAVCSCLEMPIDTNSNLVINSSDSNTFTTCDEIDSAIIGGYIPLDLYTFMIQKDFLIRISKFTSIYKLNSELTFILFILSYSPVEKIPEVLYFFKDQRVPYPENLQLTNNPNSLNPIDIFNYNKSVEYRNFLRKSIELDSITRYPSIKLKYNLLVIIDKLNIGGTETYILSLSKSLYRLGINTYILTNGGILHPLFIKNNITILTENINKFKDPENTDLLQNIYNIISRYNIKLIHCHLPDEIPLCSYLKNIVNIPIILTIHGTFYRKDLITSYAHIFSSIIFVSNESRLFYYDCFDDTILHNSRVLPNTIDTSIKQISNENIKKQLQIPLNSNLIVYCSRLSHGKSTTALIFMKSFEKILIKYPNTFAIILGDGTRKHLVDSYAEKINNTLRSTRIFTLGAVYNVSDYYYESTLVVGTGRVALEAMNCSKPIIALGLNGCGGIVNESNILDMINSNFGDHSSKCDYPILNIDNENLTKSLFYLLDNPLYSKTLGNWGKNYCISQLNINSTACSIEALLDNIINTKK